jgi:hypothetical protein
MSVPRNPKNTGTDPRRVIAPQRSLHLVDVLYEDLHWSMAAGYWYSDDDGWRPVLLQRWNGWEGSKGNPISTGHPTWFVLPDSTYGLYMYNSKHPFIPSHLRDWARRFLKLPESEDTWLRGTFGDLDNDLLFPTTVHDDHTLAGSSEDQPETVEEKVFQAKAEIRHADSMARSRADAVAHTPSVSGRASPIMSD